MFHNFPEMEDYIRSRNIRKRLVLANAHDDDVLEAVVTARRKGVIEPILIGLEDRIRELLAGMERRLRITTSYPAGTSGRLPGWPAEWLRTKKQIFP